MRKSSVECSKEDGQNDSNADRKGHIHPDLPMKSYCTREAQHGVQYRL
jgi:hypothetical protein